MNARSRQRLGPILSAIAVVGPTTWILGSSDEIGRWTIILGILASVPCAVLGCYLVLRRLSLLGDAISHAVLPGIAIGFLLSGQLMGPAIVIGAMVVGVLTAVFTRMLSTLGNVPEDASLGVVFTSLFAAGVLVISVAARDVDLDPGCVLYGLIELAPLDSVPMAGMEVPRSLGSLLLVAGVTVGFVALLWKELLLVSFDEGLATAVGINAVVIHYALMAMVAGATVAAFEAVGSILVVAMLIVPAATAHLLTDRLSRMMFMAVGVAVLSSSLGYSGAVVSNSSVAGMMAVVSGALFTLAVILAPGQGMLGRVIARLGLTLRIAREDLLATLYRHEEDDSGRVEAARQVPSRADRLVSSFALGQLRRWGDVRVSPDSSTELTDRGRAAARELVRAHRLWESYLNTHFDLPADHLHDPAERIEHFIGPGLRSELADLLDEPAADPHGRTIPPEPPRNSQD